MIWTALLVPADRLLERGYLTWLADAWVIVIAATLVAIAFGLSVWGYWHHPPYRRFLMISVRGVALAAVLTIVMQPAWRRESLIRDPGAIAVLVDTSASMTFPNRGRVPSNESRLQSMRSLIMRSGDLLNAWSRKHSVHMFAFDKNLREMTRDELIHTAARGPSTRIHNALSDLRQRYGTQAWAGIVLITDGAATGEWKAGSGSAPAEGLTSEQKRFVANLGVRVHSILVGDDRLRDLSISAVVADDFAFVKSAVDIDVDVNIHGFKAGDIGSKGLDVRLLRIHSTSDRLDTQPAMPKSRRVGRSSSPIIQAQVPEEVGRQTIRVEAGKTRYRVRFAFIPQRVGKAIYKVVMPVLPGEVVAQNNERPFIIAIVRDRIRVLHLSGRPTWDQRFLRTALKRDPNVDLVSFFILRTSASLSAAPANEMALIPFPTEEIFSDYLAGFDLLVFQNFNYRPFGLGPYLPHIHRFVKDGGALAMIGGELSFSGGGYAGTAVGELLPVKLRSADRASKAASGSLREFRPIITPAGRRHPIMRFMENSEMKVKMRRLPLLRGANYFAGVYPDTHVLWEYRQKGSRTVRRAPLLAVRDVGRGRTLALATGSLWRWAFRGRSHADSERTYDAFWRNALRWLIQDPDERYLVVRVEPGSVGDGLTSQQAHVLVTNAGRGEVDKIEVAYQIQQIDGTQHGKPLSGSVQTNTIGEATIDLGQLKQGAYQISVTAALAGDIRASSDLFLIENPEAEQSYPQARPEVAREIAMKSGGQYFERLRVLPDLPFPVRTVQRVQWRKDSALWNHWWSFVIVITLLGLEWLLRRRFGQT